MRAWHRMAAVLAAALLAASALGEVLVVTSTQVLADMAQKIGGGEVRAKALVPVGAEPFSTGLGEDDLQWLRRADLVLLHGMGMEPWAGRVAGLTSAPVTVLAPQLQLERSRWFVGTGADDPNRPPDQKPIKQPDPHAYLDAERGMAHVDLIAAALASAAPGQAKLWERGAKRYREAIALTHKDNLKAMRKSRSSHRALMAVSDSFRYLRDSYDIRTSTSLDLQWGGTDAEKQAVRAGRFMRMRRIRAIAAVPQQQRGPVVETLVRVARGKWVAPLHVRLQEPGQGPSTYLDLLRHNGDVLADGFSKGWK